MSLGAALPLRSTMRREFRLNAADFGHDNFDCGGEWPVATPNHAVIGREPLEFWNIQNDDFLGE